MLLVIKNTSENTPVLAAYQPIRKLTAHYEC